MKLQTVFILFALTVLLYAGVGKGVSNNVVLSVKSSNAKPTNYSLEQNYPNPFNPSTIISYTLPEESFVTLKVFDILGNSIVTLINKNQAANNYKINFDAATLSNGIYFYKLTATSYTNPNNKFASIKKMLLLK